MNAVKSEKIKEKGVGWLSEIEHLPNLKEGGE